LSLPLIFRTPQMHARFVALLPFLQWAPRVNRVTFRADLVAGATGALIVLPQAVAFAAIAGMPPEYGIYAAIVPTIVAALFGSSWHLMAGPTTATSIVIFSTMSAVAIPFTTGYVDLVLVMSLFAGVLKLAMGVLRMGVLVNFVSQTVLLGFTAGAGILIATSQIHQFLGLDMPPGQSFVEIVGFVARHFAEIDWYIASVAIVSLVSGIVLKRWFPRAPYMIVALVLGALYAYALRFIPGFALTHHVAALSALPSPIPQFAMPRLSFEAIRKTASAAVVVGIVGLTEAMSIGRAIAQRSGQRIDSNQEFIGQGLANILGAFFSAYAASGSLNRTGLNYEAGAKTPLSSILSAFFLVVLLFAVAPLAQYLPIPAMSGVLLIVGWGLIDVAQIRKVLHVSRSESAVLIVTLLATLFAGLGMAVYLGVIISLMLYLRRTSQPRVTRVAADPVEYGHLWRRTEIDPSRTDVIRIGGSIFFGAAETVREALRELESDGAEYKHVVLDLIGVNFIDSAGVKMLAEEALRKRRMGGALYLYRANDSVLSVLERADRYEAIGRENVVPSPA
jgi:sulfate permease, SulP family